MPTDARWRSIPCKLLSLASLAACAGGSSAASKSTDAAAPVDAALDSGPFDASTLSDAGPSDAGAVDSHVADSAPADSPLCTTPTPQPDVDPWSVRAPGAGFGAIVEKTETDNAGTFTDVYLESPAQGSVPVNYTSIGVRLAWGGSIIFFGLPGGNTVDDHDTGREAQVALYDGSRAWQDCAYNASCTGAAPCGTTNNFLGWDPVQGGDWCGDGSPSSYAQSVDSLVVTASPIMWNPNWSLTTCASTCPGSAVPGGVEVTMQLRYLSTTLVEVATQIVEQAGLSHTFALQEMPCLYPSMGEYSTAMESLFDSSGTPIAVTAPDGGALTTLATSPAPWVAWQDAAQTYGLGLGADQGIKSFYAIRDDSVPFRYSRADTGFAIGASSTIRGIAYLALGNFATIQASMNAALASRPPFGHVDEPSSGSTTMYAPGAPVTVAGWVLDTAHIASVSVLVDGHAVASVPVSAARPDVCAVYPNYDGCPTPVDQGAAGDVGFSGQIDTSDLSACPHLLRVTATDGNGNTTVLGERVIAPTG
jgi:hypothetical protein